MNLAKLRKGSSHSRLMNLIGLCRLSFVLTLKVIFYFINFKIVKTVGETALTICVYFQMYENTDLLPKND